jgi:hypothetical protein
VVTKEGKEVSGLTYFGSATKATYPLVGVKENYVESWAINGVFSTIENSSPLNLMLEVEDTILEGWVNVFKDKLGGNVYSSKTEAIMFSHQPNYITTIHISYNDNDR